MSKKVLVVDDNDMNRRLIVFTLKPYDYEIIEATNGKEAIEMAREFKPDLILMDVQMPIIDGNTATKLLRQDPETRDIKIIALTSYAMKGEREWILQSGYDEYITKPIEDIGYFANLIKHYLSDP